MALSDFLSNGQIPSGSAATSTTSSTVLPDWYTNYAMQILANQTAAAANPLSTFQGPRVAEFSPMQQQGFAATGQAAGAYQPALTQATQATQQAMGAPGALTTAQPYLTQAAQTAPSVMPDYMNPYTEQVVNRIGDLGARNLSEKLMPAITSKYITAGQLGYGPRGGAAAPSGMLTDTARALRDTNADVLAQQTAALQSGYTQAQQAAQTDLARQGTLASTAGALAGNQNTQQLAGAEQLAGLGQQAQTLGLTGANAITAAGGTQQAQAQKNLDTAYADFLKQQGYPQEQINNMTATLGAIKGATPTATTTEGIVPLNYQQQYAPSTAATIGGALTGVAGILSTANSNNALGKLLGM